MSREQYGRSTRWRVWVRFGLAALALAGAATVGLCEELYLEQHRPDAVCANCTPGRETPW